MRRVVLVASVASMLVLSATAMAASALSGTYRTKVTSTALGGQVKGTWTIKFSGGVDTLTKNGVVQGHGKYVVAGTTLTFRPKASQGACAARGVYRFKLTGSTLTFTRISDSTACAGSAAREIILAGTFKKVG